MLQTFVQFLTLLEFIIEFDTEVWGHSILKKVYVSFISIVWCLRKFQTMLRYGIWQAFLFTAYIFEPGMC